MVLWKKTKKCQEKKCPRGSKHTQIYQLQLCLLIIVIVVDSNIKTYTVDITGWSAYIIKNVDSSHYSNESKIDSRVNPSIISYEMQDLHGIIIFLFCCTLNNICWLI